MPPSGFDTKQANKASEFLNLCLDDLIKEAKKHSLTYIEALNREIENIEEINEIGKNNVFEYHLLEMIKSFYQNLLLKKPNSEKDIRGYGQLELEELKKKIMNIRVPKIREKRKVASAQ